MLFKIWSGSSIWLEHLPVTQEVASSSLVRTAKALGKSSRPFLFVECYVEIVHNLFREN